jgi:hypothetical protein
LFSAFGPAPALAEDLEHPRRRGRAAAARAAARPLRSSSQPEIRRAHRRLIFAAPSWQRAGAAPPDLALGGARIPAPASTVGAARAPRWASTPRAPFYAPPARTARSRASADVCVPVDSPALHVPLARIARAHDIPVVHFVTPQYWGWAPWRVGGYRATVDRALSILPFEPAWFERRGVAVAHVGHPLLDALAGVPQTRPREDARHIVLLPGSRLGVIERNLPWMLAAVALRRAADLRRLAQESAPVPRSRPSVRGAGWARLAFGDLHAGRSRAPRCRSRHGPLDLSITACRRSPAARGRRRRGAAPDRPSSLGQPPRRVAGYPGLLPATGARRSAASSRALRPRLPRRRELERAAAFWPRRRRRSRPCVLALASPAGVADEPELGDAPEGRRERYDPEMEVRTSASG